MRAVPHGGLALLVLAAIAVAAYGDGALIAVDTGAATAQTFVVTETDQRAFLYYDSSGGIERLVLDVRSEAFSGDSLWLIPIPHQPASSQAYLEGSVSEVVSDGLDALFAATEPEINVIAHEVTVEFHSPGFGFACAPMTGGDTPVESGEPTTEEAEPTSPWDERTTESYDLSLYVGSDFDEFLSLIATEIGGEAGERVQTVVADQREHLAGYFGEAVAGRAGPFSMLLVRGRRSTEASVSSALQIDFPTESPFFALTVSRPGFGTRMSVTLLTAGPHPLEPDDGVEPYHLELALDYRNSGTEYGSETVFDGSVYHPSMPYAFRDEFGEPWFSEALAEAIDVATAGASFFGRQALLSPEQVAQAGFGSVSEATNELPYTTDLPAGTNPAGHDLWLGRFRRVYATAGELSDVIFGPAVDEPFRGRVDAHISVDAEEPVGDLSIFFALAFPGWVSLRKVWRRLTRRRL